MIRRWGVAADGTCATARANARGAEGRRIANAVKVGAAVGVAEAGTVAGGVRIAGAAKAAQAVTAGMAAAAWAVMVLAIQSGTPAAAAESPRLVCADRLLGSDGRTDLGELERAAATRWDLLREDAIVLLEQRDVEWTADRRRVETVRRAVRIAADDAVEGYADLRIAYDSLRTELKVLCLRTYRDGQWIESGPTAQVETTPSALDRAPDLSGIRERMLLHDGVELPCIVETAWCVTDLAPFRGGTDGVFVFAQEDPVVRAELSLTTPAGAGLFATAGGVPSPLLMQDEAGGTERRFVRMEFLEAAGAAWPDAAADLPHASWSTWADWASYGAFLHDSFERAIGLDEVLRDSVRVQAAEEPTPVERARALAAFVARRVRLVETGEALLLPCPRKAARVHATGYGSAFDRAGLSAGLFREAGFEAEPFYRSRGFSPADEGVPTLGRLQGIELILREPPDTLRGLPRAAAFLGVYDAAVSEIDFGTASLLGRTTWEPGRDPRPVWRGEGDRDASQLRVGLDLTAAEDDSTWSGQGFLEADGCFSPFGSMIGLGDEAKARCEAIAGSLIEGATVSGYNLSVLQPSRVVAGMSVTVSPGKPDDHGRRRLSIGTPDGGVQAFLPGDVHLSDPARRAPVVFPASLVQEVRVRLRLPAERVVRLPQPARLQNGAGEFTVTVERTGDKVTIVRTLRLSGSRHEALAWPELRALLLEETSERSRVVLYK